MLLGLFQSFDEEEDFGGRGVVKVGIVGQGAVAAAGDDGVERLDEGAEPCRQIAVRGEFVEERLRGRRFAAKQGLGYCKADAAVGLVILTGVAPIGQVAFDGLRFASAAASGFPSAVSMSLRMPSSSTASRHDRTALCIR